MKKHLVVLTGAGISADSGIKTFRDSDGLWEGYRIEEVATPGAWKKDPQRVLDFYNQRRKNILLAEPNKAHIGLAALEPQVQVSIITQNIDDLHERAGSNRVMHLHGEIFKMRSEADDRLIYPIRGPIKIGDLAEDGSQLRPHIVWFEEPVPMIADAIDLVQSADLFAVIGTSLVVYPAAGLIHYTRQNIPKIILDKKMPDLNNTRGWHCIEKSAAEGIDAFIEAVRSQIQ
jgi:NAD-dependent deacetylase